MPKLQVDYPIMYARTKNGNVKWYQIKVYHKKGVSEIHRIKASKIGGKAQTDIDEVVEGVNIGKANETSRPQQAEFNARSMVNKLKDQGYKTLEDLGVKHDGTYYTHPKTDTFTDVALILLETLPTDNTDAQGNIKPMLAHGYNEDKVIFPAFAQPKYDGVRCLAIRLVDSVMLLSRKGKQYFADHIEAALMELMKVGDVFDGELYCHKELNFQQIISAVKDRKEGNEFLPKIKYFCYDMAVPGINFKQRWFSLCDAMRGSKHECVVLSKIKIVQNIKQVDDQHDEWVQDKYEGLMLRNNHGEYEYGNRSHDLMKYKKFDTEEFEIIDVLEATGRDKGTAIFRCQLPDKSEAFNVRPEGTREVRSNYLLAKKTIIGEMLTVQYQGVSDKGIPRFPVGLALRDYE